MPLHVIETYADVQEKETIEDDTLLITSVVMRGGYEAYLVGLSEEDEYFARIYRLNARNYPIGIDPERLITDCSKANLYAFMRPGESLNLQLHVEPGEELELPSNMVIEYPRT